MKVYLDSDYIVHSEPAKGVMEAENSFFDFICPDNFECYRFIPEGHSWTRSDGKVFNGIAITLENPSREAMTRQREYEVQLLKDMQNALNALGVNVNG